MTFGEKAVGLIFNPSSDPDVQTIKEACARIIDFCHDLRQKSSPDKDRMLSLAITEIQTGQMWAVKAITWKD